MRLKGIGNSLTKFVRANAHIILPGLAMGFTISAVRQAVKDTKKIDGNLKTAEEEKGEPLTKKDIFVVKAKTYVPTIITTSLSLGCTVAGTHISVKKIAAATAYGTLMDNKFSSLKKTMKEQLGDDKLNDILVADDQSQVDRRSNAKSAAHKAKYVKEPDTLFYEEFTGRYFYSTWEAVNAAKYDLNKLFSYKGDASLNEFYDLLGIPRSEMANDVGWDVTMCTDDGYCWIEISHTKVVSEDEECYTIKYDWMPLPGYLNYSIE